MSATKKVILSDLIFFFFLLFEPLLLIPAVIPCLDDFFEGMHELGRVFLSIGTLAAHVSSVLTTVTSSEAMTVAAWATPR